MKHKLLLIYSWFVRIVLFPLPDIPFIMRFRGFLYGLGMRSCGKNFQVTHDAIIKNLENISVGEKCFVGNNSIIMGGGQIYIEDEVMFAPNVVVISGNHTSKNGSYRFGPSDVGYINIGRGTWIASNCTIQRNTKLPANSVLSANSFLNKVYEQSAIYGGVPATLLRKKD